MEDGIIRASGWLRKESRPPGTGLHMDLQVAYPGVLHLRFSPRLQGIVVCTPIDAEHTWIAARYQQDYLCLPGVGWLLSRLLIALDFQLIQPDDHRMLRHSLPRSGSLSHGALVRADRALAAWHRLHEEALTRSIAVAS